jgi:hypothetical protein
VDSEPDGPAKEKYANKVQEQVKYISVSGAHMCLIP